MNKLKFAFIFSTKPRKLQFIINIICVGTTKEYTPFSCKQKMSLEHKTKHKNWPKNCPKNKQKYTKNIKTNKKTQKQKTQKHKK